MVSGAGALLLVATPIGNLGDITRRAVEVLGAVDCVVAEDTRRSRALLSHLGIEKKPLRSLNAHGSEAAIAGIVGKMLEGQTIAYVTDAGTPSVSDPGQALASAAVAAGLIVSVLPGASAVTAAVALSGLVEGPFAFLAFLPRKGTSRQTALQRIVGSAEPTVIFESPHRLAQTFRDLAEIMPSRSVFVGRELTKLHEQCLRGTVEELACHAEEWRGELVVVFAAQPHEEGQEPLISPVVVAALHAALECGASANRISRALATATGAPRRELYSLALKWAKEHEEPESD